MIKRIDKYLLKSFIGPFVVSFGIALFVLVMQFLWLYIDEIAGKGVGILIMFELIGYMSISTFPMALPIAILIASVMVMGNLAERYELSSMKSAGVSLIRIMAGLIVVAAGVSFFSYLCSDYIIPISNLKFKSRLTDIRRQKPALTLEKGIFNEDFRQFVIRIGDKERDGETISDVMIEDHTNAGKAKMNQILADSGQMYTTQNKRYFVMNLFNGTQYQEPAPQGKQNQKYPFIRTQFKSWTKVWDMKEFELVRSAEDKYSKQRAMLSMNELRENMDSMQIKMRDGGQAAVDDITINLRRKIEPPKLEPAKPSSNSAPQANKQPARQGPILPKQELSKPLNQYASLIETFQGQYRFNLLKEAKTLSGSAKNTVETRLSQTENRRKEWVKTGYELYIKYSFAIVCFVFLFIGAPMGAIIRKGGFGYPILVSIIFFVAFIFLTILCKKLAESYVMTPFWAAMMPCIGLVPVGFYLTRKAMNDAPVFSNERLSRVFNWMKQRFSRKKSNTATA
ncbi:MAG: LptF/LptG family permease [Saprospiraceae bacterium]|nr:LptF/LptG family permease [Saprospiraceae bacterium]